MLEKKPIGDCTRDYFRYRLKLRLSFMKSSGIYHDSIVDKNAKAKVQKTQASFFRSLDECSLKIRQTIIINEEVVNLVIHQML